MSDQQGQLVQVVEAVVQIRYGTVLVLGCIKLVCVGCTCHPTYQGATTHLAAECACAIPALH